MRRRQFLATTGLATATVLTATVGDWTTTAHAAPTADPAAGRLTATVGLIDNDFDPRTGPLTQFGATYGMALDCRYRTLGVAFPAAQHVTALEIPTNRPSHRLNPRDLSVWASDDNASWTRHDAEFLDLGTTVWLFGLDVTTRYVAVHCHRDGEGPDATIVTTNLQESLFAYDIPAGSFVASGGGSWTNRSRLRIHNPHNESLRDRSAYLPLDQLGVEQLIRDGQLREDLADLRFADQDGRQLHAYCDGDGIFIRVPAIGPKSVITAYAHAGNPVATSVLNDAYALQVEYGRRTYRRHGGQSAAGLNFGVEIHPARLPDGTLMIAANTTRTGGIHARYSFDEGRTWTLPEPMIPPSNPDVALDRAGGFLVDPDTGVVTAVFYATGVSSGPDWTDPAQHLCQLWIAQADHYANGRPVFGTPRRQLLTNHLTGQDVAWNITYSDPIKTSSGAYVVPVPHIYKPDGQFAEAILRSTDGGLTWAESETPLTLEVAGFEGGISESAITELSDGRLMIIARQQSGAKYHFAVSYSTDDGVTWTPVVDSSVLATNTCPSFLWRPDDSLLLSWSGHNALGQASYWRNNLTVARSTDDGQRYAHHQDLTGATSLSRPGWFSGNERVTMIEPFMAAAGSSDLLVAWADVRAGTGSTLLVEDIDRYLQDSHGALDVFNHYSTAGVANGSELAQSRWWRTTKAGSLTLVDGPRDGVRAVRLDSAGVTVPVGASRLFPGTRKAMIRCRIRVGDTTAGLRIAVQEGFSTVDTPTGGANAYGTVALLEVQPDHAVFTTTEDVFDAVPLGGWLAADTSPATGELHFGEVGGVAFDYASRSIGVDLLQPRTLDGLVITGSTDFNATGVTRVEPGDLTIWAADTNGDWVEQSGWSGTKDGLTFTMHGPEVTTRYVKISQPYTDTAFTLAGYMQDFIHVLPARPDIEHPQDFTPLPSPTSFVPGQWHTLQFDADLDAQAVVISVDGEVVAEQAPLRHAETITHFMLLGGAGGTTEVEIAELLVQDLSLGVSLVNRIGRPGGA
ncbi:sialidase family protein [Microlunatus sp. Y2014]|uniref:sialidase family protein n=1 Tax=Microlunatus sp. Y2014 TaxID=3418488 RepID=UPI003DA7953A